MWEYRCLSLSSCRWRWCSGGGGQARVCAMPSSWLEAHPGYNGNGESEDVGGEGENGQIARQKKGLNETGKTFSGRGLKSEITVGETSQTRTSLEFRSKPAHALLLCYKHLACSNRCLSILSCPCTCDLHMRISIVMFVYSHGHSCFFPPTCGALSVLVFHSLSCGSKAAASNHQLSPISSPLQRTSFSLAMLFSYRSFILCNFIDSCLLSLLVTHQISPFSC
jgi:hypothetical protein